MIVCETAETWAAALSLFPIPYSLFPVPFRRFLIRH